jgi:hypothetical protein
MDEIVRCGQTWAAIQTPPLEFIEIGKEKGAHGCVYLLHDNLRTIGFVSQSVPVLALALRKKTAVFLNYSSLYRQLRGEQKCPYTKKAWKIQNSLDQSWKNSTKASTFFLLFSLL